MDYARFVKLRQPLWDRFSAELERARQQPAELDHAGLEGLAFGYRQVLHDHALATDRFPGTSAAGHLEQLALAGTGWLHRERPRRRSPIAFYRRSFPRAARRLGPYALVAAALFVGAAAFGLAWTFVAPGVGTSLLGPDALAGLAEGRLWTESIGTTVSPVAASSWIAHNNMSVALTAWVGGALAGLGSFYVVLLNGFNLGAILATTAHYSLGGRLLEFVAAHGPLEITLILVTAGAGLALGRALVASDDRPRGECLRAAGRDGLIVVVGCLPWFLLLGVVESYVSPSPDLSVPLKLTLGLTLEAAFLTLVLAPGRSPEDTDVV